MGLLRLAFLVLQVAKVLHLRFRDGMQQSEIDLHLQEASDRMGLRFRIWCNNERNLSPLMQVQLQRSIKNLVVLRVTHTL